MKIVSRTAYNSTLNSQEVSNTDVKGIVRRISFLISSVVFNTKPSDCVLKNYNEITQRALALIGKLFPDLTKEINNLVDKFIEIQRDLVKTIETKDAAKYLNLLINAFFIYNLDFGDYAMLATAQAIEASKVCGEDDAKYFLVRSLMAGTMPFSLYLVLLDYLNMDHNFPVNLVNALMEQVK